MMWCGLYDLALRRSTRLFSIIFNFCQASSSSLIDDASLLASDFSLCPHHLSMWLMYSLNSSVSVIFRLSVFLSPSLLCQV